MYEKKSLLNVGSSNSCEVHGRKISDKGKKEGRKGGEKEGGRKCFSESFSTFPYRYSVSSSSLTLYSFLFSVTVTFPLKPAEKPVSPSQTTPSP